MAADDDARDDERGTRDQGASLAPVSRRGRALRRLRGRGSDPARIPGDPVGDGAGDDMGVDERGGRGDRADRGRLRAFLGVVADRILETAPRIPVRDLETLRRQFPGLGPEAMADKLVAGALNGSATVGAGVGAAAMMPVPPAMPAELAAEIVGVASVELKLIAELHEVYGRPVPGSLQQRALACVRVWTTERRIDIAQPATVNAALGVQLRRELRQQLLKRTVRNLPSLTPFMVGAAVGAVMNRRDTARLARRVRDDLRRIQVPWSELPRPDAGPGSLPPGQG